MGAFAGGITPALDSDQSLGQAAWGAGIGAVGGAAVNTAMTGLLGKLNGYGWGNSPKAGLLNSTIDDAGNIKVDPIVGATNASDDAIARAMNAQQTQPRWQSAEQMPQQMVGQPHWYPNTQAQAQAGMDNTHVNPNANDVQMSVKPPKEQNAIQQISAAEEAQLRKEFVFKDNRPLQRELTSDAIAHALKQHGNPEIESRRGQIAITLDDIREHYPAITQNYDYRAPTNNNTIAYVKQINGHFITIEEVIQNGKLRFKTAWKTKGNFNQQQVFRNAQYVENRSQIGNPRPADITATQAEYSSKATPETLADNANPTTPNLNNSLQSNNFMHNLAHHAATNTLAGTAGGIANVALDDSDDSIALKFAKGFALGVAGKVAAKHGTNAGARAAKQAFEFAMHKGAQFSTLLSENPQLFTRFLNKQLTDDFAQFGGAGSGLHAECLAVAEALAKKGVSEEEILSRTGWFKGQDSQWKFQLDLTKGTAYKLKDGTYRLSQLFKQDSLYAAYPHLKDMRVVIAKLPENVQGSFEPTTNTITLNSANNKLDFTKALAHELQHAIQKHEGFAQGTQPRSPDYWTNAGELEARATFKGGENDPRQRLANELREGEAIGATSKGTSDLEIPNSANMYSIAGQNAQTADKSALQTAQQLHNEGKSSKEIWEKTGWYLDQDSQWKFEINPKGGKILRKSFDEYEDYALENVIHDEHLFAAYPSLRKLNIFIDPSLETADGAYQHVWGNAQISIRPVEMCRNLQEFKSVLYHEIQHAIQEIEGFDKGANTKLGFETYWNSLGEVEARNVQSRMERAQQADKQAKKEARDIRAVTHGNKKMALVLQDLESVENALRYTKGYHNANGGKGAEHIKIRHLTDTDKEGYVTQDELENLGVNLRKFLAQGKEPFVKADKQGRQSRIYEWENENGDRFRMIATNARAAGVRPAFNAPRGLTSSAEKSLNPPLNDDIITFYSDRNLKNKMIFENPALNAENAKLPNSSLPHPHETIDVEREKIVTGFEAKLDKQKTKESSDSFNDYLADLAKRGEIDEDLDYRMSEAFAEMTTAEKKGNKSWSEALKNNPEIFKDDPYLRAELETDYENWLARSLSLHSLKSAQGRINGLVAFAKYLANPPAHLRGDVQRLRADSAAMHELDMHTRRALTDKANAIDELAYQTGYPEPQYSMKNPRQKQKFADDSVGLLQQIRAKSREGLEKIMHNSWVNAALGTRIYGESFADYRTIKDVFDKDIV